jgi:hypothetical protein
MRRRGLPFLAIALLSQAMSLAAVAPEELRRGSAIVE